MTWRRLPGSTRLLVHRSSGRRAGGIRLLSGTSDWRRDLVDRFGTIAVRIAGAEKLSRAPVPSWPVDGIDDLDTALRMVLPGFRPLGLVLPRQSGRQRLSALGRMTGNLVVVKLGGDDDVLRHEASVLQLLADRPLPGIATPEPLGFGPLTLGHETLTFLATTGIALRGQRPAIDEPLHRFEHDLGERLGALPTHGAANTDVPVHGDLTPWNLRRTSRGLALFDWETAGWGPPGADLAHYRTACDEVRRPWQRPLSTDPIGAGS